MQVSFLEKLGLSEQSAFTDFNLAPLETRRDIAQLGVIHRAALRKGPKHLQTFFVRARSITGHSMHVFDPCAGCCHIYIKRSMFGLIGFYNRLPQNIVDITDISMFQSELQELVKKAVNENDPAWKIFFRRGIES